MASESQKLLQLAVAMSTALKVPLRAVEQQRDMLLHSPTTKGTMQLFLEALFLLTSKMLHLLTKL
jgi:hypothetical protein